jgi:hypothetical protein
VRTDTNAEIQRLEDAVLILWGELSILQSQELRRELPRLMDFCVQLHHSVEHEQAMVRHNVWKEE